MAAELERAMWAEHWKGVHGKNLYAVATTVYPHIGDGMKARLKALGIVSAAGLELQGFEFFSHGYLFYESSYEDAKKMIAWGQAYVPKKFIA
jgi:hypothetical protein